MFILTPTIKAAIAAAALFEGSPNLDSETSITQAAPYTCSRYYTIQPGDICYTIDARFGIPLDELRLINPWINPQCTNLHPGQTLCVGTNNGYCQPTYVVKPGDVCWKIAADHHIDLGTLFHNNPQINQACTNLQAGEVLCVSGRNYN